MASRGKMVPEPGARMTTEKVTHHQELGDECFLSKN